MKREKKYFCKLPCCFYSMQLYDSKNLTDAREEVRDYLGVSRLPNGTEFYWNY